MKRMTASRSRGHEARMKYSMGRREWRKGRGARQRGGNLQALGQRVVHEGRHVPLCPPSTPNTGRSTPGPAANPRDNPGGGRKKNSPVRRIFFSTATLVPAQPRIQNNLPAGNFYYPNPPLSPLGPQTPPS